MKIFKISNKKILAKDAISALNTYKKIKDTKVNDFDRRILSELKSIAMEGEKMKSEYDKFIKLYWKPGQGRGYYDWEKLKKEEPKKYNLLMKQRESWDAKTEVLIQKWNKVLSTLPHLLDKYNRQASSTGHLITMEDYNELEHDLQNLEKSQGKKIYGDSIKDSDQTEIFAEIKSKYPGVKFEQVKFKQQKGYKVFRFRITGALPQGLDRFDHTKYQPFERFVKWVMEKHGYEDVWVSTDDFRNDIYVKVEGSTYRTNDSIKDAKQYFVMHRRLWNKGLAEDGKTWVETAKAKKFNSSDEATEFARQNASQGKFEEWRIGILDSLTKDVAPNEGESKDDFINRFMSKTEKEYPDKKQRFAVALKYWNKANDSIKDSSYQFPHFEKEDEKAANRYHLTFKHLANGDTMAYGKLKDIKAFADNWLGYELNEDWLEVTDSVKDSSDALQHLIMEEEKAIEDYKNAIASSDDNDENKLLEDILKDEVDHLTALKARANGENVTHDSVKDVYNTYDRLKELQQIKRKRPLTDEEEEEYWYCKSEIDSREAESSYLNGN